MAIRLRGTDLRYVLIDIIYTRGPITISDLVAELTRMGFTVHGHPPKTISDALRWDRRRGRIVRLGWGTYGPGAMPRSTEYRIDHRALALRRTARRAMLAQELDA